MAKTFVTKTKGSMGTENIETEGSVDTHTHQPLQHKYYGRTRKKDLARLPRSHFMVRESTVYSNNKYYRYTINRQNRP